ncbi:MAG: DUF2254 domain-containing protein [Candidatus Eisenbacteria bacterium]|uniref:DUF2254 domain-containing protein n=1 Tax=Eiseniibacteriota bacterium TaxID=2212470 RepID=A0A956M387_UNCEI|nr:DUF2254 domain-containing protein [Candidatus Eisenbacteria bacterium]
MRRGHGSAPAAAPGCVSGRLLYGLHGSERSGPILPARPDGATLRRSPKSEIDSDLIDSSRSRFVLGDHRSAVQDLFFLLGQLTEIAARALSPGVNDPVTATACVERLGAAVCLAARPRRRIPAQTRTPRRFLVATGARMSPIRVMEGDPRPSRAHTEPGNGPSLNSFRASVVPRADLLCGWEVRFFR